jgi:glycine dehydrogenase subunit 2
MNTNTKLRKFHQAKWDEPIIFELGEKGERGILMPVVEKAIEAEIGDGISKLPASIVRKKAPALPEIGQMQVLKHYLRLSQENLGADLNVDIGQGTCTMKYNPKINEQFATAHQFTALHPLQDESTVQGMLEIMYKTEQFLKEISGLDAFTLQPGSGSQATLGMATIVQKYHETRGEGDKRDEIITTIFSHPSDYAAAAVKGYTIINIYQDENGLPDLAALKAAVSDRTAALFITNPEDTGIYNNKIAEFVKIVHEAGGLCGYDQANANGLLGITRAKEANFDLTFFNLHKTFSSPHGCGGPACGALGVTKELVRFMPVPLVRFDGKSYSLDYNLPDSVGKIRCFYGSMPAVLKAYAWMMSLGDEGLKEVARVAVLNNNYLLKKILRIRGASAPYAEGKHRIEQVRFSWEDLERETGVSSFDVTCRMADFGFHMWGSHHPYIIPEPFTIEPTESYSKGEMDEYVAGLQQVSDEAYETPEIVKTAPHNSVTHRPGHDTLDDPSKWAMTWRAYLKKCALGQRKRI